MSNKKLYKVLTFCVEKIISEMEEENNLHKWKIGDKMILANERETNTCCIGGEIFQEFSKGLLPGDLIKVTTYDQTSGEAGFSASRGIKELDLNMHVRLGTTSVEGAMNKLVDFNKSLTSCISDSESKTPQCYVETYLVH